MKKNARIASSLMAIALLSTAMISCGGESTGPGDNTDVTAPITDTAVVTEDLGPKPNLPEGADFGGHTVTFLTVTNYNNNFRLAVESDGETLNDAGVRRNDAVSELLNVGFAAVEMDNPTTTFRNSVMAGDTEYDFVLPHATDGVPGMVTDQLLYDWNDLPYADLTKPWWNTMMTESLGIGGHLYYASGDIVMTWQGMMAILFNKTYLPGMDLKKDLYETCFDGEWTMDYMAELIKGHTRDLNGDGQMTEVDQYGLLDNKNTGYTYMYGADQRVTVPDEDGWPVLTLNTERMVEIVNKYYNLIHSGETYLDVYSNASYPTSTYRNMIVEGRSFLSSLDVGGLYAQLREIEFDFGILPMPKLDEAQENYRVFCGAGLIGVPTNVPDPERTGAIAEALAYYSYKFIRPAFFDIVLENKAVREENAYRVLQMMHENKVFDFGFNFDNNGYNIIKEVVVDQKSTDFASRYAKKEKVILKNFEKIISAVRDGAAE